MNLLELFSHIRVFAFDVDGVLTDGKVLATEEGHLLRSINIKDVYAMQMAVSKGYRIWIISTGLQDALKARFNEIGVTEIFTNIRDKKAMLEELVKTSDVTYNSILYMGDDIPDYGAMQLCELPCCPNDAVNEIRAAVKYISPKNGGEGCVRDVIEKVLKINLDWDIS